MAFDSLDDVELADGPTADGESNDESTVDDDVEFAPLETDDDPLADPLSEEGSTDPADETGETPDEGTNETQSHDGDREGED